MTIFPNLYFLVHLTVAESYSHYKDGPKMAGTVHQLQHNNLGMSRYLKHVGSTKVFCVAPNKHSCPAVFGGTKWKLDAYPVSDDEIPKGSEWYIVTNDDATMNGSTTEYSATPRKTSNHAEHKITTVNNQGNSSAKRGSMNPDNDTTIDSDLANNTSPGIVTTEHVETKITIINITFGKVDKRKAGRESDADLNTIISDIIDTSIANKDMSNYGSSLNLGTSRYVKHLGLTNVFCNAPSKPHCPAVFGGTEWKFDVNPVSATDIPKGSKWYIAMDDAIVFCTAESKSDCPVLPGPDAWVMLPADVKVFCRTEDNEICDDSGNRTWHRIKSLISSTAENLQNTVTEYLVSPETTENADNAQRTVTTPKRVTLITKSSRPGTIKLEVSTTTEHIDPEPETITPPILAMEEHVEPKVETIIITFGKIDSRKSGKETNGKEAHPETNNKYSVTPVVTTVTNAPKLKAKPENSTTNDRIKSIPKDNSRAQTNDQTKTYGGKCKRSTIKTGNATIYCCGHKEQNCLKINGIIGTGRWRVDDSGGAPENASFEMSLGDATILCDAPTIERCPRFSNISEWQPKVRKNNTPKEDGKDKKTMWVKNYGVATIYCTGKDKGRCPAIKGMSAGEEWVPYNNSKPSENVFEMLLGDAPIFCSAVAIEECPIFSNTAHWHPKVENRDKPRSSDSTNKRKIWVTKVGNARIYCNPYNDQECPKIEGMAGGGIWKPEYSKGPPENVKFEMLLGNTPILCSANTTDQCPKLSETGQWHPIVDTSNKPNYDDDDDDDTNKKKKWSTNTENAKVYCNTPDVQKCPKIKGTIGGGNWTPEYSIGPPLEAKFEMFLGEIPILCSAPTVDHCPKLSKTHEWHLKPEKSNTTGDGTIMMRNMIWVKNFGNATVYCRSQDKQECIKMNGLVANGDWHQTLEFEMRLGDTEVLCHANNINKCPNLSNVTLWHPKIFEKSDNPKAEGGIPKDERWVIGTSNATLHCISLDKQKCPKMKGSTGGSDWKLVGGNTTFEIKVNRTTLCCTAETILSCPKLIGKFKWHPKTAKFNTVDNERSAEETSGVSPGQPQDDTVDSTDESTTNPKNTHDSLKGGDAETAKGAQGRGEVDLEVKNTGKHKGNGDKFEENIWTIKTVLNATIYCHTKDSKNCPKITSGIWKLYVSKGPPTKSTWQMTWRGIYITCHAPSIDHCPKASNKSPWVLMEPYKDLKDHRISEDSHYDKQNETKKDSEISKTGDDGNQKPQQPTNNHMDDPQPKEQGRWQNHIGHTHIYCDATSFGMCPAIHGGLGWKVVKDMKDSDKPPKNSRWVVRSKSLTVYCDAQDRNECPKVNGCCKWEKFNVLVKRKGNDAAKPYERIQKYHGSSISNNERQEGGKGKPDSTKINYDNYQKPEKRGRWVKQNGKTNIYCDAASLRMCPVIHGGSDWKEVKNTSELPKNAVWFVQLKSSVVYCDAQNSNTCPKILGRSKWRKISGHNPNHPVNNPTPKKKGRWMKQSGDMHIYCDAVTLGVCPAIHGGTDWKKVQNTGKRPNGVLWIVPMKSSIIYCDAREEKECPRIHRHSKWRNANKNLLEFSESERSVGEWVNKVGNYNFYCETEDAKNCPKIKGGGNWEPWDRCSGAPKDDKWVMIVDKTTITCNAVDVTVCTEAFNKTLWVPVTPKDTVPVSERNKRWMAHDERTRVYCDAACLRECAEVHGGFGWKRLDDSNLPPQDGKWIIKRNFSKMYCNSEYLNECPKIKGAGKWQKFDISGNNERKWATNAGKVMFYCEGSDIQKCPKINGGGVWNRLSADESNEGGKWSMVLGDAKLYCDAKNQQECSKGYDEKSWCDDTNKDCETFTKGQVKNSSLGTTTENAEKPSGKPGFQVEDNSNDDVVRFVKNIERAQIFCDSETVGDCPEAGPGDWELLAEPYLIENLPKGPKWYLEVGDKTLYCVGLFSNDCPSVHANNNGWKPVILSLEGGGRWVKKFNDTKIYCDTIETWRDCPRIPKSGEWRFVKTVLAGDTEPEDTKWIAVATSAKLYCSSSELERCDKIWKGEWGRIRRGRGQIFCDANDMKQCPVISGKGKWVRVRRIVRKESPHIATKAANDQ